jgi:dihydroflavonol-4-reductase
MEPNPLFWAGRRVCVTGGTGFLGSHLVRQLLQLNAEVRVLALPPRPDHPLRAEPRVQGAYGDLLDPQDVRRAVAGCSVIFHTAGLVGTWGPALKRMHDVHVRGTCHVLAEADPGTRVVHTSSVMAVGAYPTAEPVTEETPFNLQNLPMDYVQAKRASELVAMEAAAHGQAVIVVNPGFLIGPDDHDRSYMGRLCLRFWKGRLPVAPPGGLNLVDVRDAARGHLLAAEHGRPGRRYLLGGEDCSTQDFLRQMAKVAGLRPRSLPRAPHWLVGLMAGLAELRAWMSGKEPYPSFQERHSCRLYWYCRSDRARAELGYVSRPLLETLADTHRWYLATEGIHLRWINRWWMRPQAGAERAA